MLGKEGRTPSKIPWYHINMPRVIQSGWYAMRWFIFERDEFACQVCGQTAPSARLEVDHLIEVSEGGTDDPANLRTLCFACNRGRNAWFRMRVVVKEPHLRRNRRHAALEARPGSKIAKAKSIVAAQPDIKAKDLAELVDTSHASARVMLNRLRRASTNGDH